MSEMERKLKELERLLGIMNELREKCPWDRKQTPETLRTLTIEETYELSDAIMEGDQEKIKKELGDLLLHIVFYARIGEEQKAFDIGTVTHFLCEKLIQRHPHIYGDVQVKDEHQVKENWEKIKLKEKESQTAAGFKSVLAGVPLSLPALVKSWRIQEKARAVGFDWERPEQVWEKVEEEIQEVKEEVNKGDVRRIEEEIGDLFFALVNYSRFVGVNPEDALERTNRKFIRRFQYMEKKLSETNKEMSAMSLAELDVLWNEAKVL
ncbi:MAG: nucleoside triphosphate pyrophosphohydrolase [Bacteroidia bacterium]|nr:nucleoside triphosphate pyrophosphohydrolase [Bacteroidia bacterium]